MGATKFKKMGAYFFRSKEYLKIRPKIEFTLNISFLESGILENKLKLRYLYAKHIFGIKESRDD